MSVLNIILVILLLYSIITVGVYFFQRKLLYHPSVPPNFNQETTGLGLNHKFEKITIAVEKNINLNGWLHIKDVKKKTICVFRCKKILHQLVMTFQCSKLCLNENILWIHHSEIKKFYRLSALRRHGLEVEQA